MKILTRSLIVILSLFLVNPSYGDIIGNAEDVSPETSYGVMMIGGGIDVDEAFKWMAKKAGHGDFVVITIKESQMGSYDEYIYSFGVDSVENILIDSTEKANSDELIAKILKAEAIFIPGGSQINYINLWKNTKLIKTLEHLLLIKKIPIGGTSAGMAIMGEFYFAPVDDMEYDPLQTPIRDGLGKDFIHINLFKGIITDTHYDNRKRQGRHVAFMALLKEMFDLPCIKGIGIDEDTALCIDEDGTAEVHGEGSAYFHVTENNPECCEQDKPLHWDKNNKAIKTYVAERGNKFDLKKWDGTGGCWKYFYVLEGKLGCIDLAI